MKYILFVGDTYYPDGGWEDFRGLFDTKDIAVAFVGEYNKSMEDLRDGWDWYHVVNALSLEVEVKGYIE